MSQPIYMFAFTAGECAFVYGAEVAKWILGAKILAPRQRPLAIAHEDLDLVVRGIASDLHPYSSILDRLDRENSFCESNPRPLGSTVARGEFVYLWKLFGLDERTQDELEHALRSTPEYLGRYSEQPSRLHGYLFSASVYPVLACDETRCEYCVGYLDEEVEEFSSRDARLVERPDWAWAGICCPTEGGVYLARTCE